MLTINLRNLRECLKVSIQHSSRLTGMSCALPGVSFSSFYLISPRSKSTPYRTLDAFSSTSVRVTWVFRDNVDVKITSFEDFHEFETVLSVGLLIDMLQEVM